MLMDGMPWLIESKSRKSRKSMRLSRSKNAKAQVIKNSGVPPSLATGLCQIRHSLPIVGVEQRCGSAARSGMLSGEGNNAPAELGDSLCISQIFLV